MQTQIIQLDNNLVLFLKGRVMVNQCRHLKETIVTRLNPTIKNIYIHLKEVDFIDSAGLGLLVGIKMSANKFNAQTFLIAPRNEVKTLFSVAKLDMIFKILDSEDDVQDKTLLQRAISKLEDETAVFDTKKSSDITESLQNQDDRENIHNSYGIFKEKRLSSQEIKDKKKEMIQSYCREALENLNEGKLYKAVQNLKNALRQDPTYLPARNNLALIYEKKPEWYNQSLEEWETLLTLSKKLGEEQYKERAKKHIAKLQKILKK